MSSRKSINQIVAYFKQFGYEVLSKEYRSNKDLLAVICPNKHEYFIRYNDFQQGHRCVVCAGSSKISKERVIELCSSINYLLVYLDAAGSVSYVCDNGHSVTTSFKSFWRGRRCPKCRQVKYQGESNPNYKGGISSSDKASYSTYSSKLIPFNSIKSVVFNGHLIISTQCHYCGRYFEPSTTEVIARIKSINSGVGESNFYCSSDCKLNCSTYKRRNKPKSNNLTREVQPELRKLVLVRDLYICKKCRKNKSSLHCHHITGILENPIESADIDNCITLCSDCHKLVHKLPGCGYNDLKCKEVKDA